MGTLKYIIAILKTFSLFRVLSNTEAITNSIVSLHINPALSKDYRLSKCVM
jgi:hypothetical protein